MASEREFYFAMLVGLMYIAYYLDLHWFLFRSLGEFLGKYKAFSRGEIWSRPWWTPMDRLAGHVAPGIGAGGV